MTNIQIYGDQLKRYIDDFNTHILENPVDVTPNWGGSTFPTFPTQTLLNTNTNFLVDKSGESVERITTQNIQANLGYTNLPIEVLITSPNVQSSTVRVNNSYLGNIVINELDYNDTGVIHTFNIDMAPLGIPNFLNENQFVGYMFGVDTNYIFGRCVANVGTTLITVSCYAVSNQQTTCIIDFTMTMF